MSGILRRFAAVLLAAVLLAGAFPAAGVEAAVKKPSNCRFVRWNNSSFTSCRVAWNKVPGLGSKDYYEIKWTYADGSGYHHRYQYSSLNVLDLKDLSPTHIYKVRVRTVRTNGKAITGYSSWSDKAFVSPMPQSVLVRLTNQKKNYVKISWNRISGAAGYSIRLARNPARTWTLCRKVQANVLSTTIKRFRGSRLKKNTNYYVRIFPVSRRRGKTVSVPLPYSSYYSYRFQIVSR